MDKLFISAARVIESSDALLITAGAGMGVDSGLPDFRGSKGSGTRIRPTRRSASNSPRSPTRDGLKLTRNSPGDSTAIG